MPRPLSARRSGSNTCIPPSPPLFSVVVVCFNHTPFIEECLASIHAQEVPFRIEVIVGDDGSTDDI